MKPYLSPISQISEFKTSLLMNDNVSGCGVVNGIAQPGSQYIQEPK